MRNFTLENYEDKLNHQVIHMDQAVCYCPEFRATQMMHDYPSRKLQLARAVYKNELEANTYIADVVFNSILSRQGERWQNFGECAEDCTDVQLLSREMLQKKGFGQELATELKKRIADNDGHILPVEKAKDTWKVAMPVTPGSQTALFLDDATAVHCVGTATALGHYFKAQGISFANSPEPIFAGWEYFAYGLIDDGIAQLKKWIADYEDKGIQKVMVLSAQAAYLLGTLAPKVGITPKFEVVYLVDAVQAIHFDTPSYVYAGSFNLRYLGNGESLNEKMANKEEEPLRECPEFTPLYIADNRVNKLTIWQKPVIAEYTLIGMNQEVIDAMREDAIADIKKSGAKQVVVFDPYAYHVLKEALPELCVSYYFECL